MTARDEVESEARTLRTAPATTHDQPDPPNPPDGPDQLDGPDEPHDSPPPEHGQQHSRRLVTTLVVVLAAVLLVTGPLVFWLMRDRTDLRDDNAALRRSLEIARGDAGEQIQQLEDENAALADQIQALLQDLVDTQLEVDELGEIRQDLVDELAATSDELATEQERSTELQDQLDAVGTEITPMPDLLGIPLEEAQEFADEIGAELIIDYARPAGVISPPGKVIEQLPAEGVTVVPGSAVWVQVYGEPVAG
jgi:hypothetical protein